MRDVCSDNDSVSSVTARLNIIRYVHLTTVKGGGGGSVGSITVRLNITLHVHHTVVGEEGMVGNRGPCPEEGRIHSSTTRIRKNPALHHQWKDPALHHQWKDPALHQNKEESCPSPPE